MSFFQSLIHKSMDDMDKFTLECLVNKQTYKKYLAKHDPESFHESEELYEKLRLHKSNIESITEFLLLNPDSENYNRTLRESFEAYMKSVLYHIEIESETHNNAIYEEDEPDEMLIDVTPSAKTPMLRAPSPPKRHSNNPIEYWKKYNVYKGDRDSNSNSNSNNGY